MNPWLGLKGIPKEIWLICVATLINRMGMMALPFLVLYLTRSVGLSVGRASFAITVYGIWALITAPIAGKLSDRVGPLKVMKTSLFVSGALLLLFPLAKSYAAILVLIAMWSVTSEAFRPAGMAIISDLAAPDQRRSAFVLNRLAINLGMSIGPATGGLLASISFPSLFIVDGATSLAAAAILVAMRLKPVPHKEASDAAQGDLNNHKHSRWGALADRKLIYFLMALLLVEFVFFQNEAAVPLFLVRDLQMSEALYGLLFTINTLLIILIEVPLNGAMANWPHNRVLSLGVLLFGIGFGVLFFVNSFAGAAVSVVIWTFGEMILFPTGAAYVADISPANRRGEYMGLYTMSFSVAFAVAPWLGAQVYERAGGHILWPSVFALGCVSAVMMFAVKHEGEKQ